MKPRIRRQAPTLHALAGSGIFMTLTGSAFLCGGDAVRDRLADRDEDVSCLRCRSLLAKMAEKGMRRP